VKQTGSAIISAMIGSLTVGIVAAVIMQQAQTTQGRTRGARIKSAQAKITSHIRQTFFDANSYESCGANCVRFKAEKIADAREFIPGADCGAGGVNCGIIVEDVVFDQATGDISARVIYTGTEVPIAPEVINAKVPADIYRRTSTNCPAATPLLVGFDVNNEPLCRALPSGCPAGQFISRIDPENLNSTTGNAVFCQSWPAQQTCAGTQYISRVTWTALGSLSITCSPRRDPFVMEAPFGDPTSYSYNAESLWTQPTWPTTTTTSTTTTSTTTSSTTSTSSTSTSSTSSTTSTSTSSTTSTSTSSTTSTSTTTSTTTTTLPPTTTTTLPANCWMPPKIDEEGGGESTNCWTYTHAPGGLVPGENRTYVLWAVSGFCTNNSAVTSCTQEYSCITPGGPAEMIMNGCLGGPTTTTTIPPTTTTTTMPPPMGCNCQIGSYAGGSSFYPRVAIYGVGPMAACTAYRATMGNPSTIRCEGILTMTPPPMGWDCVVLRQSPFTGFYVDGFSDCSVETGFPLD